MKTLFEIIGMIHGIKMVEDVQAMIPEIAPSETVLTLEDGMTIYAEPM